MSEKKQNTLIIGGGVIGLATGWQLARSGLSVTIFEAAQAGASTSRAGAGMLAPNAEAIFEEEELLKHNRHSLSLLYPFLEELQEDTNLPVPSINHRGSLLVALDQDDRRALERLYRFRKEIGLEVEWLTGTEIREMEPLLSPRTIAGLKLGEDCEIDNVKLIYALKDAFVRVGGELKEHSPVEEVLMENGKPRGIYVNGSFHEGNNLLVAAGSYSSQIKGVPEGILPPLRPVKGQIVELESTEECDLSRMVRSPRIYLVPKDTGRLLVGATSEEKGFDTTVTAGGVWYVLDEGWRTVPGIYELPKTMDMAGLRPTTPDHRPVMGPAEGYNSLFLATGFFRHGFLLMPLAAYGISGQIMDREQPVIPDCFLPERFSKNRQAT